MISPARIKQNKTLRFRLNTEEREREREGPVSLPSSDPSDQAEVQVTKADEEGVG